MAASVQSFKTLVDDAHAGRLKLPAFQRHWRWRTEKVIRLYDSLRQRYPIGSLLFLGGDGANLAPRAFNGSSAAAPDAKTEYLVLDGQQRLTAGVHLFHGTGNRQYYVDLRKLAILIDEAKVDMDDEAAVSDFCASLDNEDGYIVARRPVQDPRTLLVGDHLLCTTILANTTALNQAMLDYADKHTDRRDLLFKVVSPKFSMATTESVPFIAIDARTQLESISRIFTTLNTTGQLLTPFELVVATLYPQKIDLVREVKDLRETGTYYPNMDKTGEILLQTIAMLAGKDPKKANLPKSIDGPIYLQHKTAAYQALEDLGDFLTHRLGAGLDQKEASLVPYDAIYAPMACVLRVLKEKSLDSQDRSKAEGKLARWFAGSALIQRYQEGVHNKQKRDYSDFLRWIDDDSAPPPWVEEVSIPLLSRASFEGAIGKLIQCCLNLEAPKDPATQKQVGFRSGTLATEKHHIFPTKYLTTLPGWNKKQDSGDTILNMMFVERATNKRWLNMNPADQVGDAAANSTAGNVKHIFATQLIPEEAFQIIQKPGKSKADFDQFVALRQQAIRSHLKNKFAFELSVAGVEEEEDEDPENGAED